jgi:NADPH:quinone reductase-like Zn-dependent oxidoreductase
VSEIDFFSLFGSGANFRHISVGSREGLEDVSASISMSAIRPAIDRVFDFEDAREACSYVDRSSGSEKSWSDCPPRDQVMVA